MRSDKLTIILLLGMLGMVAAPLSAPAGDLDDGISEATEDPIAGDDSIKDKDVNINYIVINALAKSKLKKIETDPESAGTGKDLINYNNGEGESNENSIIVEPGSNVDTVINIVEEK